MINIGILKKNFENDYIERLNELSYERKFYTENYLSTFDKIVDNWQSKSLKILNTYNKAENFINKLKEYFKELNFKDIYNINVDTNKILLTIRVNENFHEIVLNENFDINDYINTIYNTLKKIDTTIKPIIYKKYLENFNLFNKKIVIEIKF